MLYVMPVMTDHILWHCSWAFFTGPIQIYCYIY